MALNYESIEADLVNKLAQNKVVAFVGSGLSQNLGLPDWHGLLCEILDKVNEKDLIGQKLKNALNDDIITTFDVLKKLEPWKVTATEVLYDSIKLKQSIEAGPNHKLIGELTSKIITTNYDSLLEIALPDFEKITFRHTWKLAKLSTFEKFILKIHGDIDEPDTCVLLPSQYDEIYKSESNSAVFELKKIISDKSILFLGFSLNDPYINNIFEYINNVYSGFNPDNYIITTKFDETLFPNRLNPILLSNYSELTTKLETLLEKTKALKTKRQSENIELMEAAGLDIINISESSDFDSAPVNKFWVGREKEIESIKSQNFKVIFITGIGGQGKSALASHFISKHFDNKAFEFADWRDFKEESNRLQTKISSVIKRLNPNCEINFEQLTTNEIIDIFFTTLGNRRIVFVFDNVDNYVDLISFKPTGSLEYLFDQAISRHHNSKFIFTCRPFIREALVDFYQITLTGVQPDECELLFKQYNINISEDDLKALAERAHRLTKGHPLWLNLIAGQAIRGLETVGDFMSKIEGKTQFNEDNFTSILSEKVLSVVWASLNDKQKILIRGIAETVKPETESILCTILESELTGNQFQRSLRTLKNLNLIETLSGGEIELHPLVKEFVLAKYPKQERSKFITLFVRYYDKFIYILKPQLSSSLTIKEFQNWTLKIELQINSGDFASALIALEEVSQAIITAGYSEEYLRVAFKLYENINWQTSIDKELTYFHSQLCNLMNVCTQSGRFDDTNKLIIKYKEYIQGKSYHYLGLCSQEIYCLWYQGNHPAALKIGERAVDLLEESQLADNYNLRHNLGLAMRDTKNLVYIEKALNFFKSDDPLIRENNKLIFKPELGGPYYGNIGKCLEFLGDSLAALDHYIVSFKLLTQQNQPDTKLNIGYASFWISNILSSKRNVITALHFLRLAQLSWETTSPPRLKETYELWSLLPLDEKTKQSISELTEWKLKTLCVDFINNYLNNPFSE